MKTKLFFTFLFLFSLKIFSQQYIFGKAVSENGSEIPGITVTNIYTDENVVTNTDGNFMIRAVTGQEIRLTKSGFDRVSVKVSAGTFSENLRIIMHLAAQNLEAVNIVYKPTGNLAKDSKHYSESTKVQQLKSDISSYMAKKSDIRVLQSKPGEFVQPVGPGFSVGKVDDRWDDIDFMDYLISNLGEDYFTEDLKIQKPMIQNFILYVFRNFERQKIIHYGKVSQADLARFITVSTRMAIPFNDRSKVTP